jgi:CheY-like chemotaxis protein
MATNASQGRFSGVEILMAEDSLTQAMKLQFLLEDNGFRATLARDGRAAWQLLQARDPATCPRW